MTEQEIDGRLAVKTRRVEFFVTYATAQLICEVQSQVTLLREAHINI